MSDTVENILIGLAFLLWLAGTVCFVAWVDHRWETVRRRK